MHQGSLKLTVRRLLTRSLLFPCDDDNETVQPRANGKERKEFKHTEKDVAKTLPYYFTPSSVYNKQQKKKVITQNMNNEKKKPSRLYVKHQEDKGVQSTRIKMLNPKTSTVQPKHNGEPQHPDLRSHYRAIAKAITDSSRDKTKSKIKATRRAAITISVIEDKKCYDNDTTIKYCIEVNDVPKSVGGSNDNKLVEQMKKSDSSRNLLTHEHKIYLNKSK